MTPKYMHDAIARHDITGLVLAGGQGSRMGGVDKGLLALPNGAPLAQNALERLRPQTGALLLSANRNLEQYAAWGIHIVQDPPLPAARGDNGFAGPLAGILAGLQACASPYLLCVPCDVPAFPPDLALRLGRALLATPDACLTMVTWQAQAHIPPRLQPTFCLIRTHAATPSLHTFLTRGERKLRLWAQHAGMVEVLFRQSDAAAHAFDNINTAEALRAWSGEAFS